MVTLEELKPLVDNFQEAQKLHALLDASGTQEVGDALQFANEVMGGHGVEGITYANEHIAEYVNMGDTYATTLVYHVPEGEFYVTSWGDVYEEFEKKVHEDLFPKLESEILEYLESIRKRLAVTPNQDIAHEVLSELLSSGILGEELTEDYEMQKDQVVKALTTLGYFRDEGEVKSEQDEEAIKLFKELFDGMYKDIGTNRWEVNVPIETVIPRLDKIEDLLYDAEAEEGPQFDAKSMGEATDIELV